MQIDSSSKYSNVGYLNCRKLGFPGCNISLKEILSAHYKNNIKIWCYLNSAFYMSLKGIPSTSLSHSQQSLLNDTTLCSSNAKCRKCVAMKWEKMFISFRYTHVDSISFASLITASPSPNKHIKKQYRNASMTNVVSRNMY